MKEATGELSMTAIVVVIIGVIAIAAPPIVRSVIESAGRGAKCLAAFNCETEDNKIYSCKYMKDGEDEPQDITCTSKDLGYETTEEE